MATRAELIKDMVGALLFMCIGGFFLRELGDLPEAAAMYPSYVIYFIFALSLALLAKSVAPLAKGTYRLSGANAEAETAAAEAAGEQPVKFGFATVFVLVISFLYVLAMPYIGFTIASAAMLLLFMLVMGVRSLPILILVPAVEIAFLLYVFEKLLTVYLPNADALREWLGWM